MCSLCVSVLTPSLLQMLGTFILWFGWYGFNSGSALLTTTEFTGQIAALAAVNSTLSAGFGGLSALFLNLWYLERMTGEPYFDLKYAMNGSLSGLVAITAGCAVLEPWAAAVTGCAAGVLYLMSSRCLVALRIDDAVDAIPVHFVNGMWGLISVGLLAAPGRLQKAYGRSVHAGWFYEIERDRPGDATLLWAQCVGLLFIVGWVMIFMLPFFVWLDWKGWFRSDPLEELVGLDTSYHGGLPLNDSDVNPEYISAFKRQRQDGTLRRRRMIAGQHSFNDSSIQMNEEDRNGAHVEQQQQESLPPERGQQRIEDYEP